LLNQERERKQEINTKLGGQTAGHNSRMAR